MIKLNKIEKVVLACNNNSDSNCANCIYDKCNKEDYGIILASAIEKEEKNVREKDNLNNAKKYFESLGYEIVWSKSYKKYILTKDYKDTIISKDSLIAEYIINKAKEGGYY